MSSVSVRVLKNELSDYLRRAEAGERVVVTRDGVPVAALVALATLKVADDPAAREQETLARLVREGILTQMPAPRQELPPLVELSGPSITQILLEDRR